MGNTITLARAIPTLKGDLEEGRAHVLRDHPGKRWVICALRQCSDICSGIKSAFGTLSSSIKAGICFGLCSDILQV